MVEPINLRQARKKKARADKTKKAEANRVEFGASKADKRLGALNREQSNKALDAAKRDKPTK